MGIILIATGGEKYTKFVNPLIDSINKYMPEHQVILFTDDMTKAYDKTTCIFQKDLGWPRATLNRYHTMLKQREFLLRFSHLLYMDIDMLVNSQITLDEIFADGMTVVLHPGYPETFERNPASTAFVPEDDKRHNYYQGCFVGGKTDAFIRMCETITKNIDTDDGNGIMAVYHDESMINRYMIDNPPAKILSPAYCFPGPAHIRFPERWMQQPYQTFVPKIRHLEKLDQASWKNK